jgi:WD40 repeat protein
VGLSDNTMKIWDWSTNTVLLNLTWKPSPWSSVHGSLKFLLNGLLVASLNTTTSQAYDWKSGQVKFQLNGQVMALEQLSNGNLMGATVDNYFRIWNPQTGQLIYQLNAGVTYLSLRQTNIPNLVAAGGVGNNNVNIFNINTLQIVQTMSGNVNAFLFLEMIPSGLLLGASGVGYNGLKIWNVTTAVTLGSILFGTDGQTDITCLKVVSDNQLVVAFAAFSRIQFLNIATDFTFVNSQTVNLVTSSLVWDMRLTMEDILLLAQADGSVFFMDINTKSFVQALSPVSLTSLSVYNIDLIGETASTLISFLPNVSFKAIFFLSRFKISIDDTEQSEPQLAQFQFE